MTAWKPSDNYHCRQPGSTHKKQHDTHIISSVNHMRSMIYEFALSPQEHVLASSTFYHFSIHTLVILLLLLLAHVLLPLLLLLFVSIASHINFRLVYLFVSIFCVVLSLNLIAI